MRGLWLEGRSLRLRDDLARPPSGEALVKVLCAGICNTDLELLRGYYPYTGVPGHEFVGRVEEAPIPGWVGKRVVGEINASCGSCETCGMGLPTHCPNRTVLGIRGRHGAFAEHLSLPLQNLHEVPEALPDELAVFAEPTAAALQIQEQVKLQPSDRILIVGDGKLGNLIAQTLGLKGHRVLVIGHHPENAGALRKRGLDVHFVSEVSAASADVVVECTGQPLGLVVARQAVRPRGTIVLKSTHAGETTLNLSAVVVDEITLVGSRCGPFAPALDLLSRALIDVRPLIHARYPLVDALAAFDHAARPGTMKVLLHM